MNASHDVRGAELSARVWPMTVAADGPVAVGGVALAALAATYGTPLVVYDERHLQDRCRHILDAFPGGASYATKAFICTAMASLVSNAGLGLDVASDGELETVLAAGVPADRIVMHGNNKSDDEIRAALDSGVGRIVVDSHDEIRRLQAATRTDASPSTTLLLRVNPAVSPATHAHISTGGAGSKFGFAAHTLPAAVAELRATVPLAVEGVHVHVGSQLTDLGAIEDGVRVAARMATDLSLPEVSVGGGLGIAHTGQDAAPSVTRWGALVHDAAHKAGFAGRVVAEPGRALVGNAAVTIYRVGTIKHTADGTRIVAVDGGLSDNPRPALYGARYEAFILDEHSSYVNTTNLVPTRVVGKNCESGDTLIASAPLPERMSVGSLLVVPATGAYTHAMSSNYNKLPRPAVVFVRDGKAALVVRRQTTADLLACDVLQPAYSSH